MTIPKQIWHGTIQGYRNDGCRQACCRAAKRDHQRALNTPKIAARRARLAAEHATTGQRPTGCTCDTCTADRHAPATRAAANDRANTRRRHNRAAAATEATTWPFTRHALHQADPNPRESAIARSVVCCETEAIEDEGAGHDEWCPTNRKDAA